MTTDPNTPVLRRQSVTTAFAVVLTAAAAIALIALALSGHHFFEAHALKAAGGFKDVKPIEGISHFVDGLQSSLSWLFITALILVIITVGFLFMAGHSRAHDYALRVVVGVAIVACAGGIVA